MVKEAALVGKAMTLLEILGAEGTCSISSLAERAGLPLATTHRIVRTLIDRDYVTCVARSRYMLGTAVLHLGAAISVRQLLAEAARPLLRDLSTREGLHTYLAVLEDDMVTYLVKSSSGQHPYASAEGLQLEAYCTGVGKVLLAHLPPEALQSYLRQGELVALTANTITSPGALRKELDRVREQGWSVDREETMAGLQCVAVPIRSSSGDVCAAISASGAASRVSEQSIASLSTELREVSRRITERAFFRRNGSRDVAAKTPDVPDGGTPKRRLQAS
jgi:DNA-binding IclR family transcriptional regulator